MADPVSDTFFFIEPYWTNLWIGNGDTYEVLLKVWIKSVGDEEKLRQSRRDWSTIRAKSCATPVCRLRENEVAQARATPSPSGEGDTSFSLAAAAQGAGAEQVQRQKVDLKTELKEIREWITETAREMYALDAELAPVWRAENDTKDSIRRTHGERLYDPAGAPARVPCFEQLLQVSIKWGKVKNERRETARQLKAYEREADRISREIARNKRRVSNGKET